MLHSAKGISGWLGKDGDCIMRPQDTTPPSVSNNECPPEASSWLLCKEGLDSWWVDPEEGPGLRPSLLKWRTSKSLPCFTSPSAKRISADLLDTYQGRDSASGAEYTLLSWVSIDTDCNSSFTYDSSYSVASLVRLCSRIKTVFML